MKNYTVTMFQALAIVLLILTAGCATPALWKQTAAKEWKPHSPDRVVLLINTNQQRELAILFRQFRSQGSTNDYRIVGWPASQSPGKLVVTGRALGQLTNSCKECESVPLFVDGNVPDNASSLSPGYAVWHSTDQQLTVHITGLAVGPFTLPTSHQERQTALRVCVLPVAVATDAALVGAALFAVGLAGYVGP